MFDIPRPFLFSFYVGLLVFPPDYLLGSLHRFFEHLPMWGNKS